MRNPNYPTLHEGDKITLTDRTYVEALYEQERLFNSGVATEILTKPHTRPQVILVTRVFDPWETGEIDND